MAPVNVLKAIRQTIETIIRDKEPGYSSTKKILSIISKFYAFGVRQRVRLYERGLFKLRRLTCMVISVGNLTAGGTGKTPMTVYLSRELSGLGYKVAIVSRGYRGSLEKNNAVVNDGTQLLVGPEQSGDEPYLMGCLLPEIPIIVGADRYTSGSVAIRKFHPDIVIMDDGFQHIQLHRDLNLLLLDAKSPLGNGQLLPRGPLREPVSAISRADAVLLTRSDDKASDQTPSEGALKFTNDQICPANSKAMPVFRTRHRAVLRAVVPRKASCTIGVLGNGANCSFDFNEDSPLFAFSGLARNKTFQDTISRLGGYMAGRLEFSDHYPYSPSDIQLINHNASVSKSRYIVTTDKDYVRLPTDSRFVFDLFVFGVEIEFLSNKERWREFLTNSLKLYSKK